MEIVFHKNFCAQGGQDLNPVNHPPKYAAVYTHVLTTLLIVKSTFGGVGGRIVHSFLPISPDDVSCEYQALGTHNTQSQTELTFIIHNELGGQSRLFLSSFPNLPGLLNIGI